MSNVFAVNGSSAVIYPTSSGIDAGMTAVSPDTLLAYCQMRLGDLDGQIDAQMKAQKTALREREAVQGAQNVLAQFGTAGPSNPKDMQACVTAIDKAIAQLPSNDPVAAKLADFRKQLCDTYQFTPARPLTPQEQMTLEADQGIQNSIAHAGVLSLGSKMQEINRLNQIQTTGYLGKPPDKDAKEWQGTTDTLNSLASDIKSNAEIEMLQLQELVSQRQQAVQLASSMMSKEDQTLESQAKAIGQ
jgi:hypothetical protein